MNMLNGDEAMSPAEFAKLMGAYPQPAEIHYLLTVATWITPLLILHGFKTMTILVQKGMRKSYLSLSRLILPIRQANKESTKHTEKWR